MPKYTWFRGGLSRKLRKKLRQGFSQSPSSSLVDCSSSSTNYSVSKAQGHYSATTQEIKLATR